MRTNGTNGDQASESPADGANRASAFVKGFWRNRLWPLLRVVGRWVAKFSRWVWATCFDPTRNEARQRRLRNVLYFLGLNTDADPNEHRASRGFLHVPPRGQATLLVFAFILSYLFYTWAVRYCYQSAWIAYSTGNVMDAMLDEMPRVYEPRNARHSRPRQRNRSDAPEATAQSNVLRTLEQQSQLLLLYMQELDVIDADSVLVDTEKDNVFKLLQAILIKDGKLPFHQRPTVDVVVDVVTDMASSAPAWYQGTAAEFKRDLADVLTAMLADYPGIPGRLANFQSLDRKDTEFSRQQWAKLVAACDVGYGAPVGSPHWFRLNITGTNASVAEILHLLYRQADFSSIAALDEARSVAGPIAPTNSSSTTQDDSPRAIASRFAREEIEMVERFLSKQLSRMQALDSVKEASLKMAVVRGYEQFALLVAFWWMALLLAARYARRRKEEDRATLVIEVSRDRLKRKLDDSDKKQMLEKMLSSVSELAGRSITRLMVQTCHDSQKTDKTKLEDAARYIRVNDAASRWVIVWLSRTLPALGFLGTVHGIALALMGADSLVRAVTPEGQAAAVNIVASNLGIAFTTTFIALVMGIALSWVNDRQSYQERLLVTELERELGYLLDPVGFDPSVEPPVKTVGEDRPTMLTWYGVALLCFMVLAALVTGMVGFSWLWFIPLLLAAICLSRLLWRRAERVRHEREKTILEFSECSLK